MLTGSCCCRFVWQGLFQQAASAARLNGTELGQEPKLNQGCFTSKSHSVKPQDSRSDSAVDRGDRPTEECMAHRTIQSLKSKRTTKIISSNHPPLAFLL